MSTNHALQAGRALPFGATALQDGVNFAVMAEHAHAIDLCVFDATGQRELARHRLHGSTQGVFHGFLSGAGAGLVYGYRAHGDYAPERGLFYNPNKLLLDPYASDVLGPFIWGAEHHAYELGNADGLRARDPRDNASTALKARVSPLWVTAPAWQNAPRVADAKRVLYEVHVKGFSQQHLGIPSEMRGTYAALAHPASIAHFKRLGVTTLSLLPVHLHIDEEFLTTQGRSNYWGYNTIGFFSVNPRWSTTPNDALAAAHELQCAIAQLHEHGIEVLLDVVYNHTAEGNEWGPSISFRGLDHSTWYRLDPGNTGHCLNWTGCGNTLNMHHPRVMQMVMDSLRHFALHLGVDGFRFDLAPVLGRTRESFDARAAFFQAVAQDPVLSQVVMVAEPWDAGPQGYQVGGFPAPWLEWNDKFRDAMRAYWVGKGTDRATFARRFLASSDVYQAAQRAPTSSVNFVAVHDGFTAADLLSYSHKHNHANGENNRDGRDDELCTNFGAEGPSTDTDIAEARNRALRGMLTTLALAQGTPMFCAGDEIAKTQHGNNNAYCQDSPISWIDWQQADHGVLSSLSLALKIRSEHPALAHDQWFNTPEQLLQPASAQRGRAEVSWHLPQGGPPMPSDWHDAGDRALACCISVPLSNRPSQANRLLLIFNPHAHERNFCLPAPLSGAWQLLLDSSASECTLPAVASIMAPAQSVLVLQDT